MVQTVAPTNDAIEVMLLGKKVVAVSTRVGEPFVGDFNQKSFI